MANKDANSGSITTGKPSMAFAVASLQLSSRQVDVERATLVELRKQLVTGPECLPGDRAENCKEFLEAVNTFHSKAADTAVLLWNEASKRNERFNLEADFKKIDAKAQDSLSRAKSARVKRLKGQ